MSKLIYRIRLSDPEQKLIVMVAGQQPGTTAEQQIEKRVQEKAIITNLLKIFANSTKAIKETNLCLKSVTRIDSEKDADYIDLSQKELAMIRDGYSDTANQRPNIWFECIGLLAQIEEPSLAPETEDTLEHLEGTDEGK